VLDSVETRGTSALFSNFVKLASDQTALVEREIVVMLPSCAGLIRVNAVAEV
jgi:hypothetical protein